MDEYPLISIIVPAYNAENYLRKCINALVAQDYPNKEIIVVNDGSTDGSASILQEYTQINVIETEGVGPGAARNLALAKARGQYAAFTDADCIPGSTWLTTLYEAVTQNGITGAGGPQLSSPDDTPLGQEIHAVFAEIGFISGYMQHEAGFTPTQHNASCNAIYKKEALTRIGEFRTDLWPGEDVDLDQRLILAGYKLLHTPKAIVHHYRPDTIAKLFKMMISYGGAQAELVKSYGVFRAIQYIAVLFPVLLLLEIALLKTQGTVFAGFNICAAVALFLYFFTRTKNAGKAVLHIYIFLITISGWLLGFYSNMFGISKDICHVRRERQT